MTKTAVVTDTDASLPSELADRLSITLVPISVQFGAKTLDSGIDLDDAELFRRVNHDGRIPTTAAPTPGKYVDAYKAAFDRGANAVVCICVSSKVSASYQSALTACELMPGYDITVVDSNSLSMGQGFMAIAAAEAIASGATKDEAVRAAIELRGRTHLFASLATLRYLAMSGRVGYLTAGMASLLSVKPILTIRDGKLDMLERVRTQKKSWARVVELCQEATKDKPIERMALLHVVALDDARLFYRELSAQLPCPPDPIVAELTPGLSIHAGTGVVGVAFVTGK